MLVLNNTICVLHVLGRHFSKIFPNYHEDPTLAAPPAEPSIQLVHITQAIGTIDHIQSYCPKNPFRHPYVSPLQATTATTAKQQPHAAGELTAEHIAEVVNVVPHLRQYDAALWQRAHRALTDQGFSTTRFQRIISGQPELLAWQPDALQLAIECWRGASQFGDHRVLELLEQYPELFRYRDERQLGQRLTLLLPYAGTAKNIWLLLMGAPNLLTDRKTLIEARIEYVRVQMRAELSDVCKSTVFAHSMQSLRTRHTFLDRLGLYKLRSLKVNPLLDLNNRNPRMHAIFDTDDKTFAQKVCGVTLDEWEVFGRLYAAELEKGGGVMAGMGLVDAAEEEEDEDGEDVVYN